MKTLLVIGLIIGAIVLLKKLKADRQQWRGPDRIRGTRQDGRQAVKENGLTGRQADRSRCRRGAAKSRNRRPGPGSVNTEVWSPATPIDFEASIARYTRWGNDILNVVEDGCLYRISQSGFPYRVRQLESGEIEVRSGGIDALDESRHRLADLLPSEPVRELGKRVRSIGEQLTRLPGYRPPMSNGILEALVGSISAQQVNLSWAATTRNRLVERYGRRHEFEDVTVWEFPSPSVLAAADPHEIRAMQFTTRKSEYVVDAATAVAEGALDYLDDDSDEAVIERIVNIRGLGRWTAEWFLARTLARPHAIAAGDLGVRKAVSRFVSQSDETVSEADVRMITADWGDGGNWGMHLLLERLSTG